MQSLAFRKWVFWDVQIDLGNQSDSAQIGGVTVNIPLLFDKKSETRRTERHIKWIFHL